MVTAEFRRSQIETLVEAVIIAPMGVTTPCHPPSPLPHPCTHTHTLTEHGDNRGKASALKKLIQLVLNGERLPGLLMTIIRFVMPNRDHQIKKLLLIFWEIWPKTTPDGKLLHEMILVCDAYRKVSGVLA